MYKVAHPINPAPIIKMLNGSGMVAISAFDGMALERPANPNIIMDEKMTDSIGFMVLPIVSV
ncbi:MAG: hypothetical protein CSA23_05215 [Deltaproteobacteria bacterium]|nr:MAG: hypothetical protein CSA23_05215 [Deltaproteobacteria bacterium]